jgi:hypothetical protein
VAQDSRKETLIVSKIPTPFIGGSESPRRDAEQQEIAPPFHPGSEETEPLSPEAAPELEDRARLEESGAVEEEVLVDPVDIAAGEVVPISIQVLGADSVGGEQESDLEGPVAADGTDFPGFLAGPDGIALDVEEEVPAVEPVPEDVRTSEEQETVPLASLEQLAEKAAELKAGELDAWIRSLVDQLGPYAPEIAIARAFAAGYLAAKDSEES